jgi:broad specificity phosphatase PhoE/predicted kinase
MSRAKEPGRTALVMVGLPARGKSFIARKLARYFSWLGHPTRVFNVGSYRREHVGSYEGHRFFDPENAAAVEARKRLASRALDDMIAWLAHDGAVAVYDATNTTRQRRDIIVERCRAADVEVAFIETICTDAAMVEANIRGTKLRSPDYVGMSSEEAVEDFRQRIKHYERVYEPIDDESLCYVKHIDAGRQMVINRIEGYVPARVVAYLMNLRPSTRPIWVVRHGESLFNVDGRIGGDSELSERGLRFAGALAEFFADRLPRRVWTSTLTRTRQTAKALGVEPLSWRALDEIDAGTCDGMSYRQIAETMPDEYAARAADKLRYRYPRGESYEDVVQRLDPLIAELERHTEPLLIVGHQAVLRVLYAYVIGEPRDNCPFLSIPLHTVIELVPTAYGCDERRFELDV